MAIHPFASIVAGGDEGGTLHLARLIGIEPGPPIVTAWEDPHGGLAVACAACRETLQLDPGSLGSSIRCPRPGCEVELQVNPFLMRAPAGPTAGIDQPRTTIPPAPARADPSRTGQAVPTLADLIDQAGLRSVQDEPGVYTIQFEGSRVARLPVYIEQPRDGEALAYASLPSPGMFGGEAALRSLLSISFRADYVKAVRFLDGELAFAVEQPMSLLSPARIRGLARGLAAMADVKKGDLADDDGWNRRLLACQLAQAADITVDPAEALAAIRSLADRSGLSVSDVGRASCWIGLTAGGHPLAVAVRVGERVISIVAPLGGANPKGNRRSYLQRLLELNWEADVGRIGLGMDGEAALLYEVPEVDEGLLDRVAEQFGLLLAGIIRLAEGR